MIAVVIIVVVGLWFVALVCIAFAALVWIAAPEETSLHDALQLLPDIVRLLRSLVADKTIARRARWLVLALLGYLAFPVDLIPDFIPVVGYADDAIVACFVLRHVIRTAGSDKLREHWTGTAEGQATVGRLLRLEEST